MTVRAAALAATLALAAPAHAASCLASWYGGGEYLNRRTANGEIFDPRKLTAAHRTLRFGTRVRVTYGKRSVIVRINDRGPAAWTGRCIDLSRTAAAQLGLIRRGVGHVHIQILK